MHTCGPTAQPRLGLIHLLVGTAVIAVHFAMTRSLQVDQSDDIYESALWTLWGLGAGASMSGLLLAASRRLRGRAFLTCPGEWLWVTVGVGEMARLVLQVTEPLREYGWWSHASVLVGPIAVGISLACGAIYAGSRRWRWYFVLGLLLLVTLHPFRFFGISQLVDSLVYLASALMLVVVIGIDLITREKYPWTHWTGVAIWFWFATLVTAWLSYALLVVKPAWDAMSGAS